MLLWCSVIFCFIHRRGARGSRVEQGNHWVVPTTHILAWLGSGDPLKLTIYPVPTVLVVGKRMADDVPPSGVSDGTDVNQPMNVQTQAQPGYAAYPPQGGAYPPQVGAYPPQGGAYPPQGGYPVVPFGSPPDHIVAKASTHYVSHFLLADFNQPMNVQTQAQPGYAAYPPQGGAYPPPGGAYPPQGGAYPPQGGAYPPQGGAYPPQGGAYPPQGGAYPPQGGAYPPQGGAYPPQGGAYPPQGGAYPPQGGAYPPQGGAYPPQGGAPQVVYVGDPIPPHIAAEFPDTNCEACNKLRNQATHAYYYGRGRRGGGAVMCVPNARIIIPIHIGLGIFFIIVGIVLGIVVQGFAKYPAIVFSGFLFIANFITALPTLVMSSHKHTCDRHKHKNFSCCC
eukprot:sb/3465479/